MDQYMSDPTNAEYLHLLMQKDYQGGGKRRARKKTRKAKDCAADLLSFITTGEANDHVEKLKEQVKPRLKKKKK